MTDTPAQVLRVVPEDAWADAIVDRLRGKTTTERALIVADEIDAQAAIYRSRPFNVTGSSADAEMIEALRRTGLIARSASAELRELAAARAKPDDRLVWRPIESAPKDGTRILGCWLLTDRAPLFGVVSWGLEPDHDSWAGSEEGWLENDVCVSGVTHWMLLPEAPTPTATQSEGQSND